jgi:hypothetical protein
MGCHRELMETAAAASDCFAANLTEIGTIAARCATKAEVVLDRITGARDALSELQMALLFAAGEVSADGVFSEVRVH